ncbi:MAG: dihydropteroate synthase [Gammaproteobacteria bacterium]|nr:dihydropteroate synthase [Gammaproteobacteria bacterium]MDH5776755.1 dihydropteroate synthase [Gammaproteobacteria bacterium]
MPSFITPVRKFTLPDQCVMGILNVTPDSFSDGGQFQSIESALQQTRQMVEQGAAIIDIGGESTRPGAKAVSVNEELERVIPVIEAIRRESDVPISIDTSKPEVMSAAVAAGADMVNDVCALSQGHAMETVAKLNVPVCLMHMQGEPRTMQASPHYDNVVAEVKTFLQQRIEKCVASGIDRAQILIDPGFGFGKTPAHNLSLLKHLDEIMSLKLPVLLGISRKSTIGYILDKDVDERVYGSVALTALAIQKGASIIRAHDVAATVDAIKVAQAVSTAS